LRVYFHADEILCQVCLHFRILECGLIHNFAPVAPVGGEVRKQWAVSQLCGKSCRLPVEPDGLSVA
jgi:hypothetical protein